MILLLLITARICGKMRTNGTFRYLLSDNRFNDDGEPIVSVQWSEAVPCSIKTVTNNSKGRYEDGKFNQASYEILVETSKCPLNIKRLKLERDGIELGEYPVQGLPTPTTMGRVKIIV